MTNFPVVAILSDVIRLKYTHRFRADFSQNRFAVSHPSNLKTEFRATHLRPVSYPCAA